MFCIVSYLVASTIATIIGLSLGLQGLQIIYVDQINDSSSSSSLWSVGPSVGPSVGRSVAPLLLELYIGLLFVVVVVVVNLYSHSECMQHVSRNHVRTGKQPKNIK